MSWPYVCPPNFEIRRILCCRPWARVWMVLTVRFHFLAKQWPFPDTWKMPLHPIELYSPALNSVDGEDNVQRNSAISLHKRMQCFVMVSSSILASWTSRPGPSPVLTGYGLWLAWGGNMIDGNKVAKIVSGRSNKTCWKRYDKEVTAGLKKIWRHFDINGHCHPWLKDRTQSVA